MPAMTRFLDVRLSPVGGDLAKSVAISEGTEIGNYQSLNQAEFLAEIGGRHVLIATHGFNVTVRTESRACPIGRACCSLLLRPRL